MKLVFRLASNATNRQFTLLLAEFRAGFCSDRAIAVLI